MKNNKSTDRDQELKCYIRRIGNLFIFLCAESESVERFCGDGNVDGLPDEHGEIGHAGQWQRGLAYHSENSLKKNKIERK
jgi:hypothetical protein